MAKVEELIRGDENGTLSFGDYSLAEKKKLELDEDSILFS